ncbi:hypothetical protein ACIXFT_11055 [Bacteroides fragilis]
MIQMIKRMIIKMNMKPTNNRHARAKTSRATKPNRSKVADRAKKLPCGGGEEVHRRSPKD